MTAATKANPLAGLLELSANTEPKDVKKSVDDWPEGEPIPEVLYSFVDLAIQKPLERVIISVKPDTDIAVLSAGLKLAAKERAPEKELHGRPRKDKDGTIVEYGFTLGAKRGKKNTTSPDENEG